MRLEGKVAVIVGAGQSPGEGIGNGRATTLRFAQEGARILAADRLIDSAEETAAMAAKEGGECVPFAADVTKEDTLAAADCRRRGALGTDPGEPVSPGSVGFSAGMVETDLAAFDAATTEEASAALELGIAVT